MYSVCIIHAAEMQRRKHAEILCLCPHISLFLLQPTRMCQIKSNQLFYFNRKDGITDYSFLGKAG